MIQMKGILLQYLKIVKLNFITIIAISNTLVQQNIIIIMVNINAHHSVILILNIYLLIIL